MTLTAFWHNVNLDRVAKSRKNEYFRRLLVLSLTIIKAIVSEYIDQVKLDLHCQKKKKAGFKIMNTIFKIYRSS